MLVIIIDNFLALPELIKISLCNYFSMLYEFKFSWEGNLNKKIYP